MLDRRARRVLAHWYERDRSTTVIALPSIVGVEGPVDSLGVSRF